jgi:hypothetical protein
MYMRRKASTARNRSTGGRERQYATSLPSFLRLILRAILIMIRSELASSAAGRLPF